MLSAVERFQNSQWQKLHELSFSKQVVLQLIEPGRVLDIGCGDGLLLEELKKNGVMGIGVDISSTSIDICKSRGLDCRWLDISGELPFEDSAFDSVILTDVLEHLFQPAEVLKEVHRVTARDVFIAVPNFVSFPARLQVFLGRVPENNTPRDGHVYWMTQQVISQLLADAGFEIETLVSNTFWERVPIVGRCMKVLNKAWPSFFGLSFVIKARKR